MIQVIVTKSNFVVPHKKVMENCRIQYSITYKISYSSDFKPETPNAIPTTKHTNSPQPPKLLFGSIIKNPPIKIMAMPNNIFLSPLIILLHFLLYVVCNSDSYNQVRILVYESSVPLKPVIGIDNPASLMRLESSSMNTPLPSISALQSEVESTPQFGERFAPIIPTI